MGHDRFPVASLAVCAVLSLMTGCQKFADHSRTNESSERAEKTRAMQRVAESSFWHVAPTEEEIEKLVATIDRQPSDSIVFLGADLRVYTLGSGSAESYRTGKLRTVNFQDGIDPRHFEVDLLRYPSHGRASILQVLPELLAEKGTIARQHSWQTEPTAGQSEIEITVIIDRARMTAFGVAWSDLHRALDEYQIASVDPEHSDGIVLRIAIENPNAADPSALEEIILVENYGRPVYLRDVGLIQLAKATPAR